MRSGSQSDAALTGYRSKGPWSALPNHLAQSAQQVFVVYVVIDDAKGGDPNVDPASGARVSGLDD